MYRDWVSYNNKLTYNLRVMKFKDVQHLYLGCEMRKDGAGYSWQLLTIDYLEDIEGSKPVLYSMSSMTDRQKEEYSKISAVTRSSNGENMLPVIPSGRNLNHFLNKSDPYLIVYLLSQYFDIFGLIESGEAISQ